MLRPHHSRTLGPAAILALILLLSACSITRSLPEGEKLYIGMRKTLYADAPGSRPRHAAGAADSAGVITALADGARATLRFAISTDQRVICIRFASNTHTESTEQTRTRSPESISSGPSPRRPKGAIGSHSG